MLCHRFLSFLHPMPEYGAYAPTGGPKDRASLKREGGNLCEIHSESTEKLWLNDKSITKRTEGGNLEWM